MFGLDGSELGLGHKQAREFGLGDDLYQLQQSYETLSQKVTHMSTDLREVLAHLRGGRERAPKSASLSAHSCSFMEVRPKREQRQPRQQVDPFMSMNLDPPEFGENLSPNLLIEWIQTLEWIFAFKGYSDEEAFKVAIPKLKGVAFLWYENVQRQRAKEGRARIRTWSKLQKLMAKRFLPTDSKHDLYLGVSSSSQECLVEKEDKKECEPLQIRREEEKIPEVTHLTSNITVEEKQEEKETFFQVQSDCTVEKEEEKEEATVLLAEKNTLIEGQKDLHAKESTQGGSQEKCIIQPRCTKPVQVTKPLLITSCVSDLRNGVVCYVQPMDLCLSKGAWRFVKGATHQGRPKVCPFKLGGQKHTLTPLLFGMTVWDPGIGVKVFIGQPWDLRTNPFKEGEFDAWGNPCIGPKVVQCQGNQKQVVVIAKNTNKLFLPSSQVVLLF
jgi:hypothetical protein